jgi:hypothetical protein
MKERLNNKALMVKNSANTRWVALGLLVVYGPLASLFSAQINQVPLFLSFNIFLHCKIIILPLLTLG